MTERNIWEPTRIRVKSETPKDSHMSPAKSLEEEKTFSHLDLKSQPEALEEQKDLVPSNKVDLKSPKAQRKSNTHTTGRRGRNARGSIKKLKD